MSNIDKRALRTAAEKATALNLDTAQVERGNGGYLECPCCEGAGYVEEENDFCNIDGVALGVQFYGIGEHHGLAELYLRAANPDTVLALLDELEAKEEQRANWSQMAQKLGEDLDAAEKRIAELEVRVVELPAPMNVKMGGDARTKAMFSGMNMMLSDCKKACIDAGISIKGSE